MLKRGEKKNRIKKKRKQVQGDKKKLAKLS